MSFDNIPRLDRSAYFILPVMALAFYIAFIPHQSYPYPVHIDDWIHYANADAILKAGSITYLEPFFGKSMIGLSSNLELGYQLFLGVFHQISGVSWLFIFRFLPSIIFAITVLAVYVMAQKRGFGWEAAFFVAIIPTTVGILGPAFLVPVSMGLLFIPLALFIAYDYQSIWGYVVLFVFTSFLVVIHAPSAICLIIILFPYLLLNLKGNIKHSIFLFLALIVPFLAPFPWIFKMLLPTARELLTPQSLPVYIDFPRVLRTYGYIPAGLCILGTLVLALKRGKENYGLVLGLLALLAMLVTFFTFHYGVPIMYERGLTYMMLMVGIMAGAGLMAVKSLRLPDWLTPKTGGRIMIRFLGWFFCLVLVGITLFIAIPDRQNIPCYHMINDEEYQVFVWIKDNVGEEYGKAILDPWKATPFVAITGKKVYTRIHAYPTPSDEEASKFLSQGCSDTAFLKENDISIIYTTGKCHNSDLTKVRENVYLLKK
jgi:hypothetical protein